MPTASPALSAIARPAGRSCCLPLRPELFGPIIIAGAPLSYWQGVHGKISDALYRRPARRQLAYAFTSDLGAGKFDGAWLVQNFENQKPSNTLWSKQYNLYSKIDTEASRYLGFERWWGGHVNLNAEEIQFIVDELFIGNHLASGNIQTSYGTPSTCAIFSRRSWRSAPKAIMSRRRNRRSAGSSIFTRCRGNSRLRPDHRLYHPSTTLAIWAPSFPRRRAQRARRTFEQYRPDRYFASRPL